MLESLIVAICIKGSTDACENASVAYYKQVGIERVLTQKSNDLGARYPTAADAAIVLAAAAQRKGVINLGNGKSLTIDTDKSMIGYKFGF